MMANIAITKRQVVSRGRWREEIGELTDSGGGGYQIKTKVGYILFFQWQGLDNSDNDAILTFNSTTIAGAENDPGFIDVASGASSGGKYVYRAIGKG